MKSSTNKIHWLLKGILFTSAAALSFEISLARFFSISQQYHFAFMVVSIALLGYGASGSFLSAFSKLLKIELDKFLILTSSLFTLSCLLSYILVNRLPFDFFELTWNKNQIFYIFLYYFLLSIPFFFAGLTISFAIYKMSHEVTKIYFSDLIGAAIGSLLVLLIFLPKGDKGAILIIFFLGLASIFFFSLRLNKKIITAILLILALITAIVFLNPPSWLEIHISPYKALPIALKYPDAKHLLTKWSPVSRVDVVDSPLVRFAPGMSLAYQGSIPKQYGISIDGGELNAITQFKPTYENLEFLDFLPTSLAYKLGSNNEILLINPRGGLEILVALVNGAKSIDCVESNQLVVDLIKNDFQEFSGFIYQRENIHVATSYGRSFIKSEEKKYDLITLCLTDVLGASSTGWYGIAENYLFTVEAFKEMYSHLTEQGIINITRYLLPPPKEELRIVTLMIEAGKELEVKNIAKHLVVFRTWGTITYLLKKNEFSEKDLSYIKKFCQTRMFDLVYYYQIKPEEVNIFNKFDKPIYHQLITDLFQPEKRKVLYKNYLFDISPVYDSSPFFFNFFKLKKIKSTYLSLGKKWLPLLEGGYLLPIILIQAFLISFLLIIFPLAIVRKKEKKLMKRESSVSKAIKIFFYFALIGMSYMFIEITFIQKLILFLGHPAYSISIVIFSFLFSSGLGSYFSGKFLKGKNQNRIIKFSWIMFTLSLLIFLQLFSFSFIFNKLMGVSLPLKFLFSFVIIFPLGFLMGFPFPTGIKLLAQTRPNFIPWAWAVNGFSSVVNSVNAQFIALLLGYSWVLTFAGIGYLIACLFLFLLFYRLTNHRNEPHSSNMFNF
ncbi:MAG: hypothetical protein ACE5WD_13120 [Candidatus Aminicenantia bacterium]